MSDREKQVDIYITDNMDYKFDRLAYEGHIESKEQVLSQALAVRAGSQKGFEIDPSATQRYEELSMIENCVLEQHDERFRGSIIEGDYIGDSQVAEFIIDSTYHAQRYSRLSTTVDHEIQQKLRKHNLPKDHIERYQHRPVIETYLESLTELMLCLDGETYTDDRVTERIPGQTWQFFEKYSEFAERRHLDQINKEINQYLREYFEQPGELVDDLDIAHTI